MKEMVSCLFASRRRHTRWNCDWSSDVCSSDLWVSGTGGGICGPTDDGNLFLAPTGVHKERIQPDDFFVVSPTDGSVVVPDVDTSLRPSECSSIFCTAVRARGARSVMHSHSLSSVLAADLASGGDHIAIE